MARVSKQCNVDGCQNTDVVPFKCKLCGLTFCSEHRLPENHNCVGIGYFQTEEYRRRKSHGFAQPTTSSAASDTSSKKKSKSRFGFRSPSKRPGYGGLFPMWDPNRLYTPTYSSGFQRIFMGYWSIGSEKRDLLASYLMLAAAAMASILLELLKNQMAGSNAGLPSSLAVGTVFLIYIVPFSVAVALIGTLKKMRAYQEGISSRFVGTNLGVVILIISTLFGFQMFIPPLWCLIQPSATIEYETDQGQLESQGRICRFSALITMLVAILAAFVQFAFRNNSTVSTVADASSDLTIVLGLFSLLPILGYGGKYYQAWRKNEFYVIISVYVLLLIFLLFVY